MKLFRSVFGSTAAFNRSAQPREQPAPAHLCVEHWPVPQNALNLQRIASTPAARGRAVIRRASGLCAPAAHPQPIGRPVERDTGQPGRCGRAAPRPCEPCLRAAVRRARGGRGRDVGRRVARTAAGGATGAAQLRPREVAAVRRHSHTRTRRTHILGHTLTPALPRTRTTTSPLQHQHPHHSATSLANSTLACGPPGATPSSAAPSPSTLPSTSMPSPVSRGGHLQPPYCLYLLPL